MGLFSSLLGTVAPIAGSLLGGPIGGAIGGAAAGLLGGSSKQSGSTTSTATQQLDPRAQAILYGDGTSGNTGLLAQYQGYLNQPQGAGTSAYGQASQDYLSNYGAGTLGALNSASANLMNSNKNAPQAQDTNWYNGAQAAASQVNAPSQNNLDLSGAYNNVINGNAGANPYLTNALGSAVAQTNASYAKNQTDLTNNLQRSVLPGIRSGAVAAGGYGGSRQGIAEGNALSDYTNQLNSSNLQLGLANSANTTGAQATAYNQGQDRSLSALQGLSGQQYATAQQNSAQQQQANLANANSFNQAAQFNLGNMQQTNLANAQLQANTNQLNSSNSIAGIGALGGVLNTAYNGAQNQDNAQINRATQVNGLLSPYLTSGGTQTSSTPYYSNTAGNVLGGATAGLGLYNQLSGSGSNKSTGTLSSLFGNSSGISPYW